jgi:prolyl oligopeptidase
MHLLARISCLMALTLAGFAVPSCAVEPGAPTTGTSTAALSGPIDLPVDPETAAWVVAQNARSRAYLATDPALQAAIRARATALVPLNGQVRTNFFGTDHVVRSGSLFAVGTDGAADRRLVDATTLPAGAGVTEFRVSPDRQKLAYGYQIRGSDWTTWTVIALADLAPLAGPFYIKSSGVDEMNWSIDSRGLFYQGWLTAADDVQGIRRPQIKFHRLGDDPALDRVVFEDDEEPHSVKYNALPLDDSTAVVYRVLGGAEVPLAVYLAKRDDAGTWRTTTVVRPNLRWGRFVGLSGRNLLLRTSDLGHYRIVSVDPDTLSTRVVVPSRGDAILNQAQQIGDKLLLQYLDRDLHSSLVVTDLAGNVTGTFAPRDVGWPDLGAFSLATGNFQSQAGYLTYSATTLPTETLKLDVATSVFSVVPGRPIAFDGSKIKTESRTYVARDGTRIPVQVFTRTDVATPPSFAYLFVYGNIGVANLPTFNRKFQLMLELGGMVAIPNVRGGGEQGLWWQWAGVFDKWRTLNDIADASRWLKASYSSIGDRVVLSGRSYGGMMTMAEYVYCQDDFALFTPVVGVSDPVAMHTEEQGWVYPDDLGYPRDHRGQVIDCARCDQVLASYAPLYGVATLGAAKPIMAFSAQYDTRVTSSQTLRFIEALHARFGEAAPVYVIEHENVGHNGRAEVVDEAVFVARELGITALSPILP